MRARRFRPALDRLDARLVLSLTSPVSMLANVADVEATTVNDDCPGTDPNHPLYVPIVMPYTGLPYPDAPISDSPGTDPNHPLYVPIVMPRTGVPYP